MIPPGIVFDAAHWFGLWLLERVLREVEDRAAAHVRDRVFEARCIWCRALMTTVVLPGEPDPPGPQGALRSRRWPDHFWCCVRCWAEHWKFDPSVLEPADWDDVEDPPDDD